MTDSRLRALRVVAAVHPKPASRSNTTGANLVYWQSADWLIARGYVAQPDGPYTPLLRLTDAGLAKCRELDIPTGTRA